MFLAIDVSAQTVVVPHLTSGVTGSVWSRTPGASWAFSGSTNRPAYRVACPQGTVYLTPALGNVGNPVLGTSYDVTLSDALASTGALSLTGFSDTQFQGLALPYALPDAPGCSVLASPHATHFVFTSPTGTAALSTTVPNFMGFRGVDLFHQWVVVDAANPLGFVVSDGGRARLGF